MEQAVTHKLRAFMGDWRVSFSIAWTEWLWLGHVLSRGRGKQIPALVSMQAVHALFQGHVISRNADVSWPLAKRTSRYTISSFGDSWNQSFKPTKPVRFKSWRHQFKTVLHQFCFICLNGQCRATRQLDRYLKFTRIISTSLYIDIYTAIICSIASKQKIRPIFFIYIVKKLD